MSCRFAVSAARAFSTSWGCSWLVRHLTWSEPGDEGWLEFSQEAWRHRLCLSTMACRLRGEPLPLIRWRVGRTLTMVIQFGARAPGSNKLTHGEDLHRAGSLLAEFQEPSDRDGVPESEIIRTAAGST